MRLLSSAEVSASSGLNSNMIRLVWGLLILCLQKAGVHCRDLCGERKLVIGQEGSDVILQVDHTGITGDITWLSAGNHFATTEVGGSARIRDKRYKGKVSGAVGGSLIISELLSGDEGLYTASMMRRTTQGAQLCAQLYNLRVYRKLLDDDLQIAAVRSGNDSCRLTITCRARESDVPISWSSSTASDINVVGDVLYVSQPDPGVAFTCSAQNPVSAASKSLFPGDYCHPGGYNGSSMVQLPSTGRVEDKDYSLFNILRLLAAAGLLIVMCWLLLSYRKESHDVIRYRRESRDVIRYRRESRDVTSSSSFHSPENLNDNGQNLTHAAPSVYVVIS